MAKISLEIDHVREDLQEAILNFRQEMKDMQVNVDKFQDK